MDWILLEIKEYKLLELLKDREVNKDAPKEKENITTKEDEAAMSPLSKSTNPHPDPKRK